MFVRDVDAACAWYERVLGFRASPHRAIRRLPITAAFCVDELVEAIEASGERILSPLKDQDYGMRDATIHDPDGNEIYVGQPTAE